MKGVGLLPRTAILTVLVFAGAGLALLTLTLPGLSDRMRGHLESTGEKTLEESLVVMEGLAESLARKNRRLLGDLPYELTDGDPGKTARLVDRSAAAFQEVSTRNTVFLIRELEDRMAKRITDRAGVLAEEFRGKAVRGLLILLGTVLLLFGSGLVVTVLLPLKRLLRATGRVAAGDLTEAVGLRSRDEVGRLGAAFDEMTAALRGSREEIEGLNRSLEDKVREQTRELRGTNERLRGTVRELEETRDALVHSETMASIGTLAGGVAHEFNNLLGGILGCAEDARADEDPAAVRESLGVILRTARRACNITENLLRFSRAPERVPRDTDLAALVGEALDLVGPETRSRDVEVRADLDPIPPVHVDPGQIHQVVLNLLTNALRAMPDGGRLRVGVRQEGADAIISVSDTGVGIPEEAVPRIFEPFFTTREAQGEERGTGLGLSVSYTIVNAHGGSIEVESRPGEGTRFEVRLPRAEGE